jgi:excisionase family DNA binding protein
VTGADANFTLDPVLEPLLSVEEVSEILHISESGVYRLLRRRALPSVKVGGRTLFERGAIRDFLCGEPSRQGGRRWCLLSLT